jgi:hypothetical protein
VRLTTDASSFRALVGIHPSLREAYEKVADLQEEGSVYFRMHSWKDGEAKFEVCSKGGPNSTVHRCVAFCTRISRGFIES